MGYNPNTTAMDTTAEYTTPMNTTAEDIKAMDSTAEFLKKLDSTVEFMILALPLKLRRNQGLSQKINLLGNVSVVVVCVTVPKETLRV